jgi:hypothetical protein
VRSGNDTYLDLLENSYSAALPGDASNAAIMVATHSDAEAGYWPEWSASFFREREIEARLRDTRFRLHYFDEFDFWQVYDRETRFGVQLMRTPRAYPVWDPGSPLRNFVHWRLLDDGAALVHAGSLGVGDRGVLLAGAGGSGKSGTVLAGLNHGMTSVGDDYIALHPGESVTAQRAFLTLKQDPSGLARAGLGRFDSGPLNWQGKRLLSITEIAQSPQPLTMAIGAICLPEVSQGTRTVFSKADPRDAFLALAPSGITQIPSARPEMFAFTARLARQLPAFRVSLGTDPEEISGAFAQFIEALAA